MKKLLTAALLSFTALQASALSISPYLIYMERTKSALVYFDTSGYKEKISLNITPKKMTINGLEKTYDLVIFPKTIKIEPNKRAAVRVWYKGDITEIQKVYRFLVNPILKEEEENVTGAIGFDLPIFIGPNVPQTFDLSKKVENGKTIYTNIGNSAYRTLGFSVDGEFRKQLIYILPGQTIEFDSPLVEIGTRAER